MQNQKQKLRPLKQNVRNLTKLMLPSKNLLPRFQLQKTGKKATTARAELKALTTQYKLDSKALDTRLKDATKKSTVGNSNLTKGKAGKKTARDALKVSQAALDTAQEKYDLASGSGEEATSKGKKKK